MENTSKFITNESDKKLLDIIKIAASKSERLDFLVGFFYFSGFHEVHEDIQDKNMRILVGLDSDINEGIIAESIRDLTNDAIEGKSNDDIKKDYVRVLKKLLNNSDELDKKSTLESWNLYKKKLLDGSLEIRKTKEPHHAKMYVFVYDDNNANPFEKGKVIIGSSNFSYKGLSSQNEINVYLQDNADVEDGKRIFENLWEDSTILVNTDNAQDFIRQIEQESWVGSDLPTPYQMYIRVLNEYFKLNSVIQTPHDITDDDEYKDFEYQTDAIRKGVDIVKKHSGVIIADVVGLGKSVIASCIAYNLSQNVIIIAPPHLQNQWKEYSDKFKLNRGEIYSSGNLEKAVDFVNRHKGKHTIIVDEVHKFRNEDTKNYSLLERICFNNDVILLSATPFNNAPNDILALLKLFQIPSRPTIGTTNNLINSIAKLQKEYDSVRKSLKNKTSSKSNEFDVEGKLQFIADEMKRIISPVVIRRTRMDLKAIDRYQEDLQNNGISFPTIQVEQKKYELKDIEDLYKDTLEELVSQKTIFDEDADKQIDLSLDEKHFVGARYIPLLYVKDDKIENYQKELYGGSNFKGPQISIGNILRLQFIRRFESSKGSFLKSLDSNIECYKRLLNWCEKKKLFPIFNPNKFIDADEYDSETSDVEQDTDIETEENDNTSRGNNPKITIDIDDCDENFLKQLKADYALLVKMKSKWEKTGDSDPKFDTILQFIKKDLEKDPKRKIIVFTEFADTADYLKDKLEENNFKTVIKYSASDKNKRIQETIRENFDAGLSNDKQKDDANVLIATDAIAEGWSLHRAGIVYNYDVPYNPMRVVQRVGRINRVNVQMFKDIFVYNYFPSIIGKKFYRNEDIATTKMKLSNAIFGGTDVIKNGDEAAFWTREVQDKINNEEQSWDVKYRNELAHIQNNDKDNYDKAMQISPRKKIKRTKTFKFPKDDSYTLFKDESPILIFSLKDGETSFTLKDTEKKQKIVLDPETAIKNFDAEANEKGFPFDSADWKKYQEVYDIEINGMQKPPKVRDAKIILEGCQKKLSANSSYSEYLKNLIVCVNSQDLGENIIKEISKLDLKKDINEIQKELEKIISKNEIKRLIDKKNEISEKDDVIQLVEIFERE